MIRFPTSALAVAAMFLALAAPAESGTLPTRAYLPLALAQRAASAAMARCKADGFSVVVDVLDRSGEPIVMLRGDDTRPHHLDSARRKAYTALTFRIPSGDLRALIEKDPSAAPLATMTGVIALGGGLPIKRGDEVVAAIGVAGAPASERDAICAQAGRDSIAAELN